MRPANVNKFTTVSSALRSFHRPQFSSQVEGGRSGSTESNRIFNGAQIFASFPAPPTPPLFSCLSWLFFVYFPSAAISIYLGPSNGHFVCALRTVSFPVFSLCHMPTIVDPVDPLQTTIRTPPSRNPRILRAALDTQTNCQAAAHSPDLQLMDFTLFTICNRFAVKFCSDTSFIVLAGGIGFRERDITRGHNKFPDAS